MELSDFLPYRMLSAIRKSCCANCKAFINDCSIIATGVRKLDNNNSVPYVEYACQECQHRGIAIFNEHDDYNLHDFCYEIILNLSNKRQAEKSKFAEHKYNNEKMTKEEINNFLKFVKEAKDHQEFLKHIGMDEEQESDNKDGEPNES